MALTTKLSVALGLSLKTTADLGSNSGTRSLAAALTLVDGVDAGEADVAFVDTRTLAASADEDLDLAGGGLLGVDGAAFAPARVKLLVVKASADNANDVVVTRPASNGVPVFGAAGDAVSVRPGGVLVLAAVDATGYAVTASTGDLINVANSGSGTGVTYDVAIVGASS
jgi:hypothetical protein